MATITRRRFIGSVLTAAGVGGAGLAAWMIRGDGPVATPTTTTGPSLAEPNSTVAAGEATTTTSPTTTTAAPTTTATTGGPVEGIPVICKEAWGALPVAGEFVTHEIEYITVHHTAVVLASNADAPGRVRQHQQFHQSRGWPDLAYHFIIDAAGNVYEGRPIETVGDTGTDYDPTGHLLICCEGDFNQQEISSEQYARLVQMVAWGAAEYAIDPATVQGHRDLAATSCPGDNLYPLIAAGTLASDVASTDVVSPTSLCGTEAETLVAAIESGTN